MNNVDRKKFTITSVIAHIDHGKTTFVDSLLAYGGYISKSMAGDARILDSRKDEQVRGITMKNSVIRISNNYFIDTPGHVDFEQLILSASNICDNFILVIDAMEGITPRAISLVKFINRERTILFLNKIDGEIELFELEQIIEKVNMLLCENVFAWEKDNVVIGTAFYCSGASYSGIKQQFFDGKDSHKNNLKFAFSCYKTVFEKIVTKDLKRIKEKYNIKNENKKHILNKIFSLEKTIFNLIVKFTPDEKPISTNIELISSFAINTRDIINKDNILFVFKVNSGEIKKGQNVFYNKKEITIEKIFTYIGDDLVEITQATEGMIVLIPGAFYKNPILTDTDRFEFCSEFKSKAFYRKKIILNDLEQKDSLIEFFKTLALIEQGLSVRKNRFGEFETKCYGEIQFEKICEDLKLNGFDFTVKDFNYKFTEYPTKTFTFKNDDFEITVENIEDEENIIDISDTTQQYGLVKSVIDCVIKTGIAIKEHISFSKISVDAKNKTTYIELKKGLTECLEKAEMNIAPFMYNTKIFVLADYTNNIHLLVQQYDAEIVDDDYDEENEYFVFNCHVPHHTLYNFIENVRVETKGSGYIELEEVGYKKTFLDYSKIVEEIQIEKGLVENTCVIKEGTKQRTLKK